MLVQRGYDLETGRLLRPGDRTGRPRVPTATPGLEVDGLVGPDTWAALYTDQPGLRFDGDGNGVIDPWEVPADCTFEGEDDRLRRRVHRRLGVEPDLGKFCVRV